MRSVRIHPTSSSLAQSRRTGRSHAPDRFHGARAAKVPGHMLTVVNVAYPLAQVGLDAAGGAEQVLATLDRALATRGHESIVLAPAGSRATGELVPLPALPSRLDEPARRSAQAACARTLAEVCRTTSRTSSISTGLTATATFRLWTSRSS